MEDPHTAETDGLTCPESHAVERRAAILQSLADLQREDALDEAREVQRECEERGEMPNPNLTSPETAARYGWKITGRDVTKL